MENVILIVLLLLALGLIGIVLLQRSEGGGLGMGGGGGGGAMSARSAASALSKITWILGAAFMACALALTVITSQNGSGSSVLDGPTAATSEETAPASESLLPPTAVDETPTPRAD